MTMNDGHPFEEKGGKDDISWWQNWDTVICRREICILGDGSSEGQGVSDRTCRMRNVDRDNDVIEQDRRWKSIGMD